MAQPMYRQIAEDLRHQIETGNLRSGEQIPAEQALRDTYGASRNTVRDAVKYLTILGLVEARPGQGTFVVPQIDPFVTTLRATSETGIGGKDAATSHAVQVKETRVIRAHSDQVKVQVASREVADSLHLAEGTEVVSRQQQRFIDDTPWSMQVSYYPLDLVRRGARLLLEPSDIPQGTIAYLKETLGLVQVGYRDWIMVREASHDEARFFELSDGLSMTMLQLTRTGFAEDKTDLQESIPFRVTVTVFPADRNQFILGQPRPLVVDPSRAPAEFVVPA